MHAACHQWCPSSAQTPQMGIRLWMHWNASVRSKRYACTQKDIKFKVYSADKAVTNPGYRSHGSTDSETERNERQNVAHNCRLSERQKSISDFRSESVRLWISPRTRGRYCCSHELPSVGAYQPADEHFATLLINISAVVKLLKTQF